jgi:hypothetical protein
MRGIIKETGSNSSIFESSVKTCVPRLNDDAINEHKRAVPP